MPSFACIVLCILHSCWCYGSWTAWIHSFSASAFIFEKIRILRSVQLITDPVSLKSLSSRNQGSFLIFCLLIEGSGSCTGSGSLQINSDSGGPNHKTYGSDTGIMLRILNRILPFRWKNQVPENLEFAQGTHYCYFKKYKQFRVGSGYSPMTYGSESGPVTDQ